MKVIVAPAARDELRAAAGWYEQQRRDLGDVFLEAAQRAVSGIQERPLSFAEDTRQARSRRTKVPGFPYYVVFFVRGEAVYLVAFAHERRRPAYWAGR